MLSTIPLKCPNCGAGLNIAPEMETFACGYCGAAQTVQRTGGTISLKLLTDAIRQVQTGTDKTAAELAIKRLSNELQDVRGALDKNRRDNFEANQRSKNICFAVWCASIMFVLLPALANRGYFGGFLGVLWIAGSAGLIYLYIRLKGQNDARFGLIRDGIVAQGDRINERIQYNRRIVDSY